ncbi:MAG: hypothetical protein Q9212_004152 [Teloschistes hypoglaucus]
MSDPVKHFYCTKHLHFFGTAQEYESHLWDSADHVKCIPCECGFDGEVDWEKHYWISEKNAKCLTCQKGFHSSQHQQIHYWNSDYHAKCTSCRMGFEDEKGLEDHYWKSDTHADKCQSCGLGFPSVTEHRVHLETAPEHIDKETCDLSRVTSVKFHDHNAHSPEIVDLLQCSSSTAELEKHHTTSTQDKDTYCDRCKVQCSDQQDFLLHKVQNPERHHLCTKCIPDYETEEDLLYHCQNSEAHQFLEAHQPREEHQTSDAQLIEIADMDNDKLQKVSRYSYVHFQSLTESKALVARKKESLCCFSGCDGDRRFDSVSSVVQHLESGNCTKGWTIQQVNDIAAEHPDLFNFLSVRYVPWFLAGLPRKTVEDSDLIRGKWKCSFCKSSHLSRSELEHHIQDEISDTAYPQLLRCCMCLVGFTTLSALISHTEGGSGWSCSNAVTIARIVSHLKTRIAEDGGYPQPLHELYELRFDPSKRDNLVVKVSMNSIKKSHETDLIDLTYTD